MIKSILKPGTVFLLIATFTIVSLQFAQAKSYVESLGKWNGPATLEKLFDKSTSKTKKNLDLTPRFIPKGSTKDRQPYQNVIINAINIILFAAGSIAVIMIIIGGIRYTTATGSEDEIGNAKKTVLYAIIGLLIIIFSFVIVQNIITYLSPAKLEDIKPPAASPAGSTAVP